MTVPRRRLLEKVVAVTDRTDRPVRPTEVAAALDAEPAAVRDCLDALTAVELVVAVDDDRYRPTVTARELLALDIDDERLLVVDPDGDS